MSPRDPNTSEQHPGWKRRSGSSGAPLQRAAILATLIEAGVEGVPEHRIPALGGMWWRERLSELARTRAIGWDVVDGEKRYVLAVGIERAGGTADFCTVDGKGHGHDPLPAAARSLNTESGKLFDLPARSHYDMEREAA